MQSLFEKDDPQTLLHAATLGDEIIAREFLNKFKNEVEFTLYSSNDTYMCTMSAMHM